MDDKQLDLRNRIAQAIVPLAELLEEIMGAAPQATVDPPKDIDYVALGESLTLSYERLAEHICLGGLADLTAQNLDMYDIAQNLDMWDLAQNIEASDVAEAVEVDYEDVAKCVDLSSLAVEISPEDYFPSADEFAALVMSDEDSMSALAKAVADEVIKRLMPQPEKTETETETETDEHKPVNLSLDPVASSDNNTGN